MEKIELQPGIYSSRLGFGCASVKGAVSGKTAKRAIDCALDCGINHFDLARSYGYGEAEKFVGNLLKEKRNELIIASKFGIRATGTAKTLKFLKPFLRCLKKPGGISEDKKSQFSHLLKVLNSRVILTKKEMRKSLEESLSALQTEYLDYFFIHEPEGSLINIEDLCELAENFKKEGKIRAWGLASMVNQLHFHQTYLQHFDVLQFNNSVESGGNTSILKERTNKSNIVFSPFKGGDSQRAPENIFRDLKEKFPKSIFLSSMFTEKHIVQNSSLFS